VRKKHREAIAEDIQQVYRQLNEAGFKAALTTFCQEWRALYPEVTKT
jgi:transposase-like protein